MVFEKMQQDFGKYGHEYLTQIEAGLSSIKHNLIFNFNKPINCLSIIFGDKTLDLVFLNYGFVHEIIRDYFYPLKIMHSSFKSMYVPTYGSLLWRRLKYTLHWQLTRIRKLTSTTIPPKTKSGFSFVQLILLAAGILETNNVFPLIPLC